LITTAAGQLSLDTHGSGFDTLLAAYTGNNVGTLMPIVANDNDGSANGTSSMLLQMQPGKEYEIAVDGANSAGGTAILNWSLNTSATANLAINISGPSTGTAGTTSAYSVLLINAGPQTATHVLATITLPTNSSLIPGPSACTAAGNVITCDAGMMQNGTQALLPLQIMWASPIASALISAAVASDLSDPTMTNNISVIQVVVSAGNNLNAGNDNTDVPTLPQWGMLLLAMLLTITAAQVQRRKPYG
jgi:uncharacterized repeat protein (TIGR01451 family)